MARPAPTLGARFISLSWEENHRRTPASMRSFGPCRKNWAHLSTVARARTHGAQFTALSWARSYPIKSKRLTRRRWQLQASLLIHAAKGTSTLHPRVRPYARILI